MSTNRYWINRRIFILLLSWFAVIAITDQLVFDFDCRRSGVDCGAGDCILNSGQCNCSLVAGDEVKNYRCQNKTDFPCSESTYGTNCSLERVQVFCTGDRMFVNINPEGTFAGKIFVYGKDSVSQCQLLESLPKPSYVENNQLMEGLRSEIAYKNDECGDAAREEETVDGKETISLTRDYFIQYSKNFRSALDQKVSITCVLTAGRAKVVGLVNDVKETNSNYKNVSVDTDADEGVIDFGIKDKANATLSGDVNLGDEIKLVFTLITGKGYVDFSLLNCTANNTIADESSADFRSIQFVENNCPTKDGLALFQNGITKSADSTTVVSISAFMFSGSTSKVGFSCDVLLCREENKDDCKKQQCQGTTSEADKQAEAETTAATATTMAANNGTTESSGNGTTESLPPDVTGQTETTKATASTETAVTPATPTAAEVTPATTTAEVTPATTTAAAATTTAATTTTAAGNNVVTNPTPTTAGGGRRKRAAGDEPVKRHVYSDMTVRDPTAIVEEPAATIEVKECMEEPEVITVIAILSVMVVTLALVTLVIVCHVISSRHRKNKMADYDGGNELRTRVSEPPPVHGFNIPRLEITAKRPNSYTT